MALFCCSRVCSSTFLERLVFFSASPVSRFRCATSSVYRASMRRSDSSIVPDFCADSTCSPFVSPDKRSISCLLAWSCVRIWSRCAVTEASSFATSSATISFFRSVSQVDSSSFRSEVNCSNCLSLAWKTCLSSSTFLSVSSSSASFFCSEDSRWAMVALKVSVLHLRTSIKSVALVLRAVFNFSSCADLFSAAPIEPVRDRHWISFCWNASDSSLIFFVLAKPISL